MLTSLFIVCKMDLGIHPPSSSIALFSPKKQNRKFSDEQGTGPANTANLLKILGDYPINFVDIPCQQFVDVCLERGIEQPLFRHLNLQRGCLPKNTRYLLLTSIWTTKLRRVVQIRVSRPYKRTAQWHSPPCIRSAPRYKRNG